MRASFYQNIGILDCAIKPRWRPSTVKYCAKTFFSALWFLNNIILSSNGLANKTVTLTTVHIGANQLYGYYFALPVFHVAVEEIKNLYPISLGALRHIPLYLPGYDACSSGADHTSDFLAKFYFKHPDLFNATQFHVLASPECSDEAIQMADLSREFDVPLFTSSAGAAKLTNRTIYPTVNAITSMAGSGVVTAVHALFQRFAWRSVAVVCDDLNSFPAVTAFYSITVGRCGQIMELLTQQKYQWSGYRFDSTVVSDSQQLLSSLKSKARGKPLLRPCIRIIGTSLITVIILLTVPTVVRRMMIQAVNMNMTSGDYVFITVQPTKRPSVPFITWKENGGNDGDNDKAFNAFRNLLVITENNPDWVALRNLTTAFSNASLKLFNFTYPSGAEETELLIRSYESTRMFAQVFDENYPDVLYYSTETFIRKFANRIFIFAERMLYTDDSGALISSIVVLRLNKLTKQMESAMSFNESSRSFYNINNNLWYWVNRTEAPRDVPVCGFGTDVCNASGLGSSAVTGGTISGVLIFVMLFCACCCSARRRQELKDAWWLVDAEQVLDQEQVAATLNRDDYTGLISLMVGIKLYFENQEVCLFSLLISESTFLTRIDGNSDFREIMFNLRRLRHANVVHSFGVVFKHSEVYLLSEFPLKGTLREVLGKEHLEIDSDLHYSFCWDILEGVDYIHQSALECHGNLNSFVCMIDPRFTLKISQTSYEHIADVLDIAADNDEYYNLNAVKLIWQPPEVIRLRKDRLKARALSLTKETDIYSIGIMFYEILTRVLPYDINLSSAKSIEAALKLLKHKNGFSGVFTANSEASAFLLPEMKALLEPCCGPWKLRPTIRALKALLKKIHPKYKSVNDATQRRLEAHAASLEIAVAAKNVELLAEIEHTDRFLQEYLPESVVKSLRLKTAVAAERFDSVTLLFCEIPMLKMLNKKLTPHHTIEIVNAVYAIFEEQLPEFDVCRLQAANGSYIVGSGLPIRNDSEHAFAICSMAVAVNNESKKLVIPNFTGHGQFVPLRMGVHSGPVIATFIESKIPRYYLIGESLHTAILMAKSGEAGKIHISMATNLLLYNSTKFVIIPKEPSNKNKEKTQTFWLSQLSNKKDLPLYFV